MLSLVIISNSVMRGRFSFQVVNAKYSDNPFMPFLILYLVVGIKFPWYLQTSSLLSFCSSLKWLAFPTVQNKVILFIYLFILICWFNHLANLSSLFPFVPRLTVCLPLLSHFFHLDCKVFGAETAFWSVLVLCSSDSYVRLPGCYGNMSGKAPNDNLV